MVADPKPAPPCVVVVFGATGDLTKRLLAPALVNLRRTALLPDEFAILAAGRRERTTDDFRSALTAGVDEISSADTSSDEWRWLSDRSRYVGGTFDAPETFERMRAVLDEMSDEFGTEGNVLFYLATPPDAFGPLVDGLGRAGLHRETETTWRRIRHCQLQVAGGRLRG